VKGKKRKLYLDIDDTVLDTENYVKKVLGGKWSNLDSSIYLEYGNMSEYELDKIKDVFSNYYEIPYISGAEEGISELQEEFDVVFCSTYWNDYEKRSKQIWADLLGIRAILCEGYTKGNVDMSDAVFVDDGTRNLNSSNAAMKVCFFQKNNSLEIRGGTYVVYNWEGLLDILCGENREAF